MQTRWLARLVALLSAEPELPLAPGERRREAPDHARSALGACAEDEACRFLRRQGFQILCRNRVNAIGELDIVAREGDTIVFVEVRSRSVGSPVSPAQGLTRRKQQRLVRCAELFLRQHRLRCTDHRIDVVAVEIAADGRPTVIEHLRSAICGPGC